MRTRHDVHPLAGAARFTALRRTRESSDIRRLDGARQGDESADARRLLANARFAYLAISLSMRPLLLSVTGACIDDKMPQSGRTNGYRSKCRRKLGPSLTADIATREQPFLNDAVKHRGDGVAQRLR
jgi:hypothetical protein